MKCQYRLYPKSALRRGLWACVLLACVGAATAQAQTDLLPDIFAPVDETFDFGAGTVITTFEYDTTTGIIPGRTHLRVSFGTANIGAGPIIFRGLQPPNPDSSLNAVQRIMRSDGTWWERPAGVLAFHPDHGHIHLADWAQYRLREFLPDGSVGQILAEGAKTSFCVIDFHTYDLGLPGAPASPVYFTCEPDIQGISVGWIDIYEKALLGQEIDITDLPNGIYWLEGEYDPENRFLESDKTNNIGRKAITLCHNQFTIPSGDSMWIADAQSAAGTAVKAQVGIHNERSIGGIAIPFSWSGQVGLTLDSATVAGTRAEGLATTTLIAFNPFSNSAAYALNFPDGVFAGLPPGSGPVMNIFFSIPPGAQLFDTSQIVIMPTGGQAPLIGVACGSYEPPAILPGTVTVTNTCCSVAGDANHDGALNIADVTFGIARIFSSGPAPVCQDEADSNGDNAFNVADVTYSINRIFGGGPAPVCGTTGA